MRPIPSARLAGLLGSEKPFGPPRTYRLLAALVFLAGFFLAAPAPAAATSAALPAASPASDEFYAPPSPLPAGHPGDVLRYRPITIPSDGAGAPVATGYLVMYLSRTATGAPTAVTGTVLVPPGPSRATAPIVGVGPGTEGIGDQCAVSKALVKGQLFGEFYLGDLLSRGWIAAVTDYEGLGTPGDHTYIVGQSAGRAVIDVVRAAQRLLRMAGHSASAPVGFYGYSEGGGAAAWAGQLQPSYAPELNVVGVMAGGVPADLTVVARSLNGGIAAGLLGYAAIGLNAAYPELRLDSYLSAYGRTAIAFMRTSCAPAALVAYTFVHLSRLVTADPLTTVAWQRRLAQNSLGKQAPAAPVYLWHGRVDQALPFSQADALHRAWCGLGARVTWRPVAADHLTGRIGSVGAIRFLADRFAGRPLPADSCGANQPKPRGR